MKKRGQFTVIVVLAIVIAAAVFIAMKLSNSVQEEEAQQSAQEALNRYVESNSLSNYVNSCLNSVTQEAMEIAGESAGNIWNISGQPARYVTIDGVKIPYVVEDLHSLACPGIKEFIDTPFHPFPYRSVTGLAGGIPDTAPKIPTLSGYDDLRVFQQVCSTSAVLEAGFYGKRTMKPLCTEEGPNAGGSIDRPEAYRICESYGGNYAVEQQLTEFIERNVTNCLDFREFSEVEGYDINVSNEPDINITFGRAKMNVKAKYPVTASQDGEAVQLYAEFEEQLDTRFKELYEFFRTLAKHETWYSDFEPAAPAYSQYPQMEYIDKRGFEVEYWKCPQNENCRTLNDNIIVVKDSNTIVNGKALEMKGMVRNRPPVLDYLGDVNIELTGEEGSCESQAVPIIVDYADPDGDDTIEVDVESKGLSTIWFRDIIHAAGQIKFIVEIPGHTPQGSYEATLMINDEAKQDSQSFNVNVERDCEGGSGSSVTSGSGEDFGADFTPSSTPDPEPPTTKWMGYWDHFKSPQDGEIFLGHVNIARSLTEEQDQKALDQGLKLFVGFGIFDPSDSLSTIRQRLNNHKSRIEKLNPEDVAFILLDDEPYGEGYTYEKITTIVDEAKSILGDEYNYAMTFTKGAIQHQADKQMPKNLDYVGLNYYPFAVANDIRTKGQLRFNLRKALERAREKSHPDTRFFVTGQAFYGAGTWVEPPVNSPVWYAQILQDEPDVDGLLWWKYADWTDNDWWGTESINGLYEKQQEAYNII